MVRVRLCVTVVIAAVWLSGCAWRKVIPAPRDLDVEQARRTVHQLQLRALGGIQELVGVLPEDLKPTATHLADAYDLDRLPTQLGKGDETDEGVRMIPLAAIKRIEVRRDNGADYGIPPFFGWLTTLGIALPNRQFQVHMIPEELLNLPLSREESWNLMGDGYQLRPMPGGGLWRNIIPFYLFAGFMGPAEDSDAMRMARALAVMVEEAKRLEARGSREGGPRPPVQSRLR